MIWKKIEKNRKNVFWEKNNISPFLGLIETRRDHAWCREAPPPRAAARSSVVMGRRGENLEACTRAV